MTDKLLRLHIVLGRFWSGLNILIMSPLLCVMLKMAPRSPGCCPGLAIAPLVLNKKLNASVEVESAKSRFDTVHLLAQHEANPIKGFSKLRDTEKLCSYSVAKHQSVIAFRSVRSHVRLGRCRPDVGGRFAWRGYYAFHSNEQSILANDPSRREP